MYREPVAIDTETHLITDLVPIPKLVCASIANRDPRASGNPIISDLKTGKDFKEQLISLLKNDNVLILAHNAKFDMAVFSVAYGFEVAKLIHLKYKKHLILCTMLNEKQLRLQSDGILPKASKGKTSEFSLEFCIKKWLGLDTNKSKDVWRKRYSELEHLPISKYPIAAREYAIKDAIYCLRVFEQQGLANKVDIFDQCHSDWLCQMSNIFGMTVDNEFLEGRYKPLEKMIKSHEYILRKTKIKQVKKNDRTAYLNFLSKYYKPKMKLKGNLDEKIKFYEEKMELAGYDVIKESLKFELPFGQNKFKIQTLISKICQKLEITPKLTKSAKNMDVDSITDEVFIKKIAVDDESLAAVEGFHKGLDAIKELGNANKVVSTYLNNWRGKDKIFPSIDILLTTGRISVYKPSLQNIPRKGRVRGCFVPENPNTHYLCSIDFGQIELCTLAQVMIWQGIGSEMADAINSKKDLHCMTGATLLNMSYEEFYAGYKADDPVICGARALAKVVNFGGFGGMGKVTFRNQARKQGINLTLQESERALLALKKTFPAQKYFNHRKVEKVHTEFGEMYKCLQLPTDRIRMISVKGFEEKGGYCAANNTYFQALAADTMKKADRSIKEQCWFEKNKLMNDVNPLLTVHDEWLGEIPIKTAHDSAFAVTKIMLDTAYKMLPDIKVIKAEPCLMKRWEKEAKPVYDKNGKLIVWEYEKHGKSA